MPLQDCRQVAALSAEHRAFANRLRRVREAAGMTQMDAARRLGKPQSFISKCESAERRVDVVELKTFAKLYGAPLTAFYR